MKFKALVPVTEMVEKEYDIEVPDNLKDVLKKYEVWYDSLSDDDYTDLMTAIKGIDPDFDEETGNAEDWVWESIIYDVRWKISKEADLWEVDDVQALADGDFNFMM